MGNRSSLRVDTPGVINYRCSLRPAPVNHQSGARVKALLQIFLLSKGERTQVIYRTALEDFRVFLNVPCLEEAVGLLLSGGVSGANQLALAYRSSLKGRGSAASTINLKLSALKSLVKTSRTIGMVPWVVEVRYEKVRAYRDTRGPGKGGVRRLLSEIERSGDRRALRDRALLRLLYDLALRVGEVSRLDIEDVDLIRNTVDVLGKGMTQKIGLSLPDPTKNALGSWLRVRGASSGPLFTRLDRARKKDARLTPRGIQRLVKNLGNRIGVKATPHGLRHAAITEALDLTNGNIRAVQRFSRHKDVRVLMRYDDNRADLGGNVACLVAANV